MANPSREIEPPARIVDAYERAGRQGRLRLENLAAPLEGGGDPPDPPEMEARVSRLEADVFEIRHRVEQLPTRSDMRGYIFTLAGITLAAIIGVGALVFAAMSNQLSAFQAGLSLIQSGSVQRSDTPNPTVIFQMPAPPSVGAPPTVGPASGPSTN